MGGEWFIPLVDAQGSQFSIRFYGHGVNDIDRIKILIDPSVPADLGAGDFTIEWWMKTQAGMNNGSVLCGEDSGWISGNILIDRDIFGSGDYGDFGVSLNNGKVAFGLSQGNTGNTICTVTNVANGLWHHIAITRSASSGLVVIYVDGQLDGQGFGPIGNISYRDGRTSTWVNDPYLVLGAEKHDYDPAYPSYNGWIDELRLSNNVRYTQSFSRPNLPFSTDSNTLALYHFDEGPEGACTGTIIDHAGAVGGPSQGSCRYGGSPLSGPVYTTDIPFNDTVKPTLSAIKASPLDKSVIITWITNEPASSQVGYGLFSPVENETGISWNYLTDHTVLVTGLTQGTTYVFNVRSQDPSGNLSVSDTLTFQTKLPSQVRSIFTPKVRK